MLLTVNLVVSLQIIFQELTVFVLVKSVDESVEHSWDWVFSAVEELRGYVGEWSIKSADSV